MYKMFLLKLVLVVLFSVESNAQNRFLQAEKRTDELVKRLMTTYNISGISLSISYNDTLILSKGYGFADAKAESKIYSNKTKFRIASITKVITALTLAKLVELDSLKLEQSAFYYLDSLSKKEFDFNLKQLGGHISGLKRKPSEELYDCTNNFSKKDFYRVFRKDDLDFKPSTQFSYSNYGYKVIGMVIEKSCNKPLLNCHKNYVLDVLNMKETIADTGTYDINTAKFYHFENDSIVESPCQSCEFKYAEGCYLSTSEDLVKLGNGVLFNRIVSENTIKDFINSQLLSNKTKTNYGIGFECNVDRFNYDYYGHSGSFRGSSSIMRIYPKNKLVITILANQEKVNLKYILNNIGNSFNKIIDEIPAELQNNK